MTSHKAKTVAESLSAAVAVLQKAAPQCDTCHLDSELLLAHSLGVERSALHAHPERPLTAPEAKTFAALLRRRAAGEPVAYILGNKSFWNLQLQVTPAVLIPRPETELLVETALALLQGREEEPLQIADLGTGSGAIAIALANHSHHWQITATDISPDALNIAHRNACRNARYESQHRPNITFLHSNWCESLPTTYDLITCNPPYVAADDPHLQALRFEPPQALIAADKGLAALKTVITQARHYLKPSAPLLLEHAPTQATAVTTALKQNTYQNITTHPDLAGHPRLTTALNSSKIPSNRSKSLK